MALIWADDYSSYGTDVGSMLDGLYAETTGISLEDDPDPLASGKVIKYAAKIDTTGTYLGSVLRRVIPTPTATVGFCQRYWLPILPNDPSHYVNLMSFCDISNTAHVSLQVETTGAISVYRGDKGNGAGSVENLGTTAPVLTANAWHHVEAKVFISDTVGTVEVRVNGVTVIELTGVDTKNSSNSTIDQLRPNNCYHFTASAAPTLWTKDFVIWDDTGSVNNDFFGSVSVVRLSVDADDSFNWTASTGTTGYDLIDEVGPDDADYVEADSTPPAASTFTLSNLPPDVTSVRGLVSLVRAKKTDGGDGNLQVSLQSNAVDDLGSDRPITTADTYWWDVSELSPDTGVAWTPAEVDAAKIKIDRTL